MVLCLLIAPTLAGCVDSAEPTHVELLIVEGDRQTQRIDGPDPQQRSICSGSVFRWKFGSDGDLKLRGESATDATFPQQEMRKGSLVLLKTSDKPEGSTGVCWRSSFVFLAPGETHPFGFSSYKVEGGTELLVEHTGQSEVPFIVDGQNIGAQEIHPITKTWEGTGDKDGEPHRMRYTHNLTVEHQGRIPLGQIDWDPDGHPI